MNFRKKMSTSQKPQEERTLVANDNVPKPKQNSNVSKWLIVAGVGLTVVGATAATVYYVNKKRTQELDDARFGDYENEGFFSRLSRYWGSATRKVKSARSIFSDLFGWNNAALSNKQGKYSTKMDAFATEEDEVDVVDGEPEL